MSDCPLRSHLGALGKGIINCSWINQLLQILIKGQINLYKYSRLKISNDSHISSNNGFQVGNGYEDGGYLDNMGLTPIPLRLSFLELLLLWKCSQFLSIRGGNAEKIFEKHYFSYGTFLEILGSRWHKSKRCWSWLIDAGGYNIRNS